MFRPGNFFKKNRDGTLFISIVLICLTVLNFSGENRAVKPQKIGMSVFSVFQVGLHGVSAFFRDTITSINELKQIREDYTRLNGIVSDYRTIEREVVELRAENQRLREQFDLELNPEYTAIPAEVIARDPGNMFTTVTVNKGTVHGVRRYMTVISVADGMQGLVGKVIYAGPYTSQIMPLYDIQSYVSARFQATRWDGIVHGLGRNDDIEMLYVKKRALNEIRIGDLLITSGLGDIYSRGIVIGRVSRIGDESWKTSLDITVRPIIEFSKLEYVYIMKADE